MIVFLLTILVQVNTGIQQHTHGDEIEKWRRNDCCHDVEMIIDIICVI